MLKNSSSRVLRNWAFEFCGAAIVADDLLTGQSTLGYFLGVFTDKQRTKTPRKIPRNTELPKIWKPTSTAQWHSYIWLTYEEFGFPRTLPLIAQTHLSKALRMLYSKWPRIVWISWLYKEGCWILPRYTVAPSIQKITGDTTWTLGDWQGILESEKTLSIMYIT